MGCAEPSCEDRERPERYPGGEREEDGTGIHDFRWKDLRHTFVTRLRMTGSDTGTIRDPLGHTSDRMTKRYAHAVPGLLHAAVQRLADATSSPEIACSGDPTGDPSVRTPKV